MKHSILALLFSVGLLHLHAADEPLIPAALNAIIPKIHPGMTIPEVEAVLAPAYPNVKSQRGDWGKMFGFIDYRLDERHTLSVSSHSPDGKLVVNEPPVFYVYDLPSKRRLNLIVYDWEKQPDKKLKDKKLKDK